MAVLNQVHAETFTRDGVEYEIRVIQARGGLVGEWTCRRCRATGEAPIIEDEPVMAVRTAQRNLGFHHFFEHQRASGKVVEPRAPGA